MGTNFAPLVEDLFLYSYEADFVQHLQKSKFKKGLFAIWRCSVQRIYSVFKVIEEGIFFTETSNYFYGYHTDLVHKFDTSVSHMLNGLFTSCDILCPVVCENRDGCHMWDRKCSLFPEHLISLTLEFMISPIHYCRCVIFRRYLFSRSAEPKSIRRYKIRATKPEILRILHFKFAGINIRGDHVTAKTAQINTQRNILLL